MALDFTTTRLRGVDVAMVPIAIELSALNRVNKNPHVSETRGSCHISL